MYSYHIVAELRQFRGAPAAADRRIHRGSPSWIAYPMAQIAGNRIPPSGLTAMDRIFLAIMVSAVLVLIAASDLLVNGPGMQPRPSEIANALPISGRVIR
ncbi:histidine kinase [Bradyrhizobium betae]|uniref:Histidine kinase n=2 Tax=Bradyrhizobium betae TaxID=244734 RepID=A0A4Q1UL74_9BRAD|nr:histidine kinase [Bradyrhizobium betae]